VKVKNLTAPAVTPEAEEIGAATQGECSQGGQNRATDNGPCVGSRNRHESSQLKRHVRRIQISVGQYRGLDKSARRGANAGRDQARWIEAQVGSASSSWRLPGRREKLREQSACDC
jgi:hypothetical protein